MVMSLRSRSTFTLSTPSSAPTAPSRAFTQCWQVTSGTDRTSWAMTHSSSFSLPPSYRRASAMGTSRNLRGPTSGSNQQAHEELGADGGDHGDVEQAGRRLGRAGPHRGPDHEGKDDRAREQQHPGPPVPRGREGHQAGQHG